MNSNDLRWLKEAYSQVHQSAELLSEETPSFFVGGGFGRGRRFGQLGIGAGGVNVKTEFGDQEVKDPDLATKNVTNALVDLKNQQRDEIIASNNAATAAAKPAPTPAAKPPAKGTTPLTGAAALGGPITAPAGPRLQAVPDKEQKVAIEPTRRVGYFGIRDASFNPQRKPVSRPVGTGAPQGQRGKGPDNKARTTTGPSQGAVPPVNRYDKFVTGDDRGTVRSAAFNNGVPVGQETRIDPNRLKLQGGGGNGSRFEQFAYYQVLSYLIDEGYASSEQAADKIILNMSEAWFENIMERKRS